MEKNLITTESFLRDRLGLKGEFFNESYKSALESFNAGDKSALAEWWRGHPGDDGKAMLTEEAWRLWSVAKSVADGFVELGLMPIDGAERFFWDYLPY